MVTMEILRKGIWELMCCDWVRCLVAVLKTERDMGITELVGENKPEQPFHNGGKINNNYASSANGL